MSKTIINQKNSLQDVNATINDQLSFINNIIEKENNFFNSKNSSENVNLENSNNEKNFSQNKTADSLLKNILDIKTGTGTSILSLHL